MDKRSEYEKEVLALAHNAAIGQRCAMPLCNNTPISLGIGALCKEHQTQEDLIERDQDQFDRWQMRQALKRYAPDIYKLYVAKYGED